MKRALRSSLTLALSIILLAVTGLVAPPAALARGTTFHDSAGAPPAVALQEQAQAGCDLGAAVVELVGWAVGGQTLALDADSQTASCMSALQKFGSWWPFPPWPSGPILQGRQPHPVPGPPAGDVPFSNMGGHRPDSGVHGTARADIIEEHAPTDLGYRPVAPSGWLGGWGGGGEPDGARGGHAAHSDDAQGQAVARYDWDWPTGWGGGGIPSPVRDREGLGAVIAQGGGEASVMLTDHHAPQGAAYRPSIGDSFGTNGGSLKPHVIPPPRDQR